MPGNPFTTCRKCGYLELQSAVYMKDTSGLINEGSLQSRCSRCGGLSCVPQGKWTGTAKGVLFEPFGLTQDQIKVAFEIIQKDTLLKQYSNKEISCLDREFQKRTNIDEQPFRKLSAWQKTRRVGYVLTVLCTVIATCSGGILAYDSLTREKLIQLPQDDRAKLEVEILELKKNIEQRRLDEEEIEDSPNHSVKKTTEV